MNTRLSILGILVLIIALLLPTAAAGAQAIRIEFTGTEWCDPNSFDFSDLRAWMAGPNFQAKGWAQTCYETANIPQMTGTTYLYDAQTRIVGSEGKVQFTGKFRLETVEGGVWTGSWTLLGDATIQSIGHGEGLYEGLELHWFSIPNTGEGLTQTNGYILDHSQ